MKEIAIMTTTTVKLPAANLDEVTTNSVQVTESIRQRSKDCLLWPTIMMTSLQIETAVHIGTTNPPLHRNQSQRRVLRHQGTITGTESNHRCGHLKIVVFLWSWSLRFWYLSRFTFLVSAEVCQFLTDLGVVGLHPILVLHVNLNVVSGK